MTCGSEFRSVKGKVAVVTGAARGLGEGIARTLASEGVDVVLADILPQVTDASRAIREAYPDTRGYGVVLDVSNEEAIRDLIQGAVDRLGKLDIMVNNAGMHLDTGCVWETLEEQLDRILAVNFKGAFFGCKYAAQQLIAAQNGGSIVNIGSFFGKVGHAGSASYGASKGAMHTMTQSLSLELAPYGINVNALCPGLAATEMHWGFMRLEAEERGITFDELKQMELDTIPLRRYGYGHDYAGAIMWLASESGSYVTGQLININGGLDFT